MSVIKGWKFPIQVDEDNGKIKTVEDNENVKQSVKLILNTQRKERKIFTNFGTDLRNFMFEVVDPPMMTTLKSTVERSLKEWEKHIKDLHISVNATASPVSTVNTSIDYITDIEPTQERVVNAVETNEK